MRLDLKYALIVAAVVSKVKNCSTTLEELVVLKVASVRCEIPLNKVPFKIYLCGQRVPKLEWKKFLTGLKGGFIREVP